MSNGLKIQNSKQNFIHTRTEFSIPYTKQSNTHFPRGRKDKIYNRNEPLKFQVIDWYREDLFVDGQTHHDLENKKTKNGWKIPEEDPRELVISLFGVTADGHSISCNVEGFQPYFWIRIPEKWAKSPVTLHQKLLETLIEKEQSWGDMDRYYRWKDPDGEWHSFTYRSVVLNFENLKVEWKYDFYAGFTGLEPKKFPFVKLVFKNLTAMKKSLNILTQELKKSTMPIQLYESNLDPILRFMHTRNILAAGWVQLNPSKYRLMHPEFHIDEKYTTSQIEVWANWDEICGFECDDIAPIRQASFDIECFSHDGKFPLPNISENVIFQIATTIQDYGSKEFIKHIITLKHCDPIDGATVICCKTEEELLMAWQKLLRESDPDIITGYNIFGFDLEYIMERAKVLDIDQDNFGFLGKIKQYRSELIVRTMSSKAYGDNEFKMLPMPGRMLLDLYPYMKKEPKKYPSYTLGYISQQILSNKLPENALCAIKGTNILRIMHPDHPFKEDMVVHLWGVDEFSGWMYNDLNTLHNIVNCGDDYYDVLMKTNAKETIEAGGGDELKVFETKHDLPPPEIFRAYATGNVRDCAKYCIQDTMLPQKIINKMSILPNMIEMSKVTYVPMSYLVTRGQQIKVYSQIVKATNEEGYH